MSGPIRFKGKPQPSETISHHRGNVNMPPPSAIIKGHHLSEGMSAKIRELPQEEQVKLFKDGRPQWNAHDGDRARERRKRQQAQRLAKDSKEHFGVAVRPDGHTEAGLFIPGVTEKVRQP